MSDIQLRKITYRELKEKPFEFKDDRYGMAAFLTESIRQTLLACPSTEDEDDCAVFVLLDGDIVIGRELRFETRLKIDDKIVWVHTGCSLEVCEEYQRKGAGVLLMLASSSNKKEEVALCAYFSTIRVKLLKKQKWTVFEIPQFMKMVDTRIAFESIFKFRGVFLSMFTTLANGLLRILEIPNQIKKKRLLKKFVLKKETIVPEWAGEMATNDGHKYMEYHDTKWLQWNLDYNMSGFSQDTQSFYAVYDKIGTPKGFFMTKERFEKEAGRYKNVFRGTIVEWATTDNKTLSEADLNLLAISTFSHRTSHITTVTIDPATAKRLNKMGFRRHGNFQISFKDYTKGRYNDGHDMSLWRIRYGCCNSIIF